MMNENVFLGGAPAVGFGAIDTSTPSGNLAGKAIVGAMFMIPMAATGAWIGHWIKPGTGTVIGTVIGGGIGTVPLWWSP